MCASKQSPTHRLVRFGYRLVLIVSLGLSPPLSAAAGEAAHSRSVFDLSLDELAKVQVTTPTLKSQNIAQTPASVRIITPMAIENRGYFTLDEALSDLPGMQFRNIQGFNSYVFIRGLPSQNNLILLMIDGVQVNELNSGGFYGGGQYNLSQVERIEVVYGPGSALYGTNAVSGIINIITKAPKDIQGFHASVLAGNFDTRQYDLSYGYYDDRRDLGLSIALMCKQSDKADLRGEKGDFNWTDSLDNFENDVSLDAKLQCKAFTFGLNFIDNHASIATKEKATGTPLLDHGVDWHIRFLNAYAKFDFPKTDAWSWHAMAYYRNTTVVDDSTAVISDAAGADPGYQERWYRPNHLLGIESHFDTNLWEQLSLSVGAVWEHETLADGFSKSRSNSVSVSPSEPSEPALFTNDLASLHAQLQWQASEALIASVGARYDDSEVYGNILTPRMGIVHNQGKFTTKLLYTQAYRAPKVWDYRDGLGNPDLVPEKMKSAELAFGVALTEHLRVEATYYRNRLSNCLRRENIGTSWRWANIDRVDTSGVEASIEYRRSNIASYLNYTYTDSTDEHGGRVPEIARHSANIGIRYHLSPSLRLHLRGQYFGERQNPQLIPATGNDSIDDAVVVHGVVSLLQIHGLDFHLIAKNLLDATYYHSSNTSVSRYRQPQRSVMLKVDLRY